MTEVKYNPENKELTIINTSTATTIGMLVSQLQAFYDEDPDCGIHLEFAWKDSDEVFYPGSIFSWRGVYHFASVEPDTYYTSLSDFLMRLRGVIGMKLQGYKGGDFVMTENTPLYVDHYGNSSSPPVYVEYAKPSTHGGVALVCALEVDE